MLLIDGVCFLCLKNDKEEMETVAEWSAGYRE